MSKNFFLRLSSRGILAAELTEKLKTENKNLRESLLRVQEDLDELNYLRRQQEEANKAVDAILGSAADMGNPGFANDRWSKVLLEVHNLRAQASITVKAQNDLQLAQVQLLAVKEALEVYQNATHDDFAAVSIMGGDSTLEKINISLEDDVSKLLDIPISKSTPAALELNVSINGTPVDKIYVQPDLRPAAIYAKAEAAVLVAPLLAGGHIVKRQLVGGRLVNFVVNANVTSQPPAKSASN